MKSKRLVLGFDTSAAHCAAALVCDGVVLAKHAEAMSRGQAERLMPLLQDLLAQEGVTSRDLSAIGVGIGPGNFTGIRISVSAARGLALSCAIPAVGVSTFQASLYGTEQMRMAIVPAPRDQLYVLDPNSGSDPFLTPAPYPGADTAAMPPPAELLAENIALFASETDLATVARPAPLYIRAADAAPARDLPPKIL